MAGIPIDLKGIYEAGTRTNEERDAVVRVAILVDLTAPNDLVSWVKDAFTPIASNAFLHVESYDDVQPLVDSSADLVVIVAGSGALTGELYDSMRIGELATVVVSPDLAGVPDMAEQSGFPIPLVDIVAGTPYALEKIGERSGAREACDVFQNALGDWIVDHCKEKRLAFANAFQFIRRPLGNELVKATAFQNGAIGALLFIPGADMPVMTLNQVKMVLQIAAAYGQTLGTERIKELAAIVGGGFACRAIARQVLGVIPAAGWAVKAGIGYCGTLAMGYAAVEYFESGGNFEGLGLKLAAARDKAANQAKAIRRERAFKSNGA